MSTLKSSLLFLGGCAAGFAAAAAIGCYYSDQETLSSNSDGNGDSIEDGISADCVAQWMRDMGSEAAWEQGMDDTGSQDAMEAECVAGESAASA